MELKSEGGYRLIVVIDTLDSKLDWKAKGSNRIAQNVYNLISTFKYEVAYDRTLGLTGAFIDKPLQTAISIATAEIFDVIKEREPRAKIQSVEFKNVDNEGNMQFMVVIDI